MGTFTHPLVVIGSDGRQRELEASVDSGSTSTCVPRDILADLGIEPRREVSLKLTNGTAHVQQLGRATVRLNGVEEITFVVFGEIGSPPIIGAITLETLLLGIDPVAQQLVPIGGWRASRDA